MSKHVRPLLHIRGASSDPRLDTRTIEVAHPTQAGASCILTIRACEDGSLEIEAGHIDGAVRFRGPEVGPIEVRPYGAPVPAPVPGPTTELQRVVAFLIGEGNTELASSVAQFDTVADLDIDVWSGPERASIAHAVRSVRAAG